MTVTETGTDTDQAASGADGAAPGTAKGERVGSLKPVIDIIPASAYDNPTWKGLAYTARDTVIYLALVAALVVWSNPLVVALVLIPMSVVVSGLFIVGHDAAHGALFKSKRLNSVVGHLVMLPSWHVWEGWVLGHNRIHHAYTVRQGFDFVWHPTTPEEFLAMPRWKQWRHRVEWSWAGAGLYYLREVWWNKMIVGKPPARWRAAVRRDRLFVLAYVLLAGAGLAALGWARTGTVGGSVWMVARVLVLPFLAFCYVVGSFVHVHHVQPGIKWLKRREWTKFAGQMEGTTILRAPKGMNFFIHWIMVHIPHHVDMRIPMYHLEEAAEAIKAAYPDVVHDDKLRFSDFVRNTRQCKLYDFDAAGWVTYDQALAAAPAPEAS